MLQDMPYLKTHINKVTNILNKSSLGRFQFKFPFRIKKKLIFNLEIFI
jgi:hypothetical protein